MEYQAAQHEMLMLKHKIIPIMYKDISHMKSEMDPTLKSVLNSVTYLEWPGEDVEKKKFDHFWNKLSLSLPKKKVHESPSLDTQLSTTASTAGLTMFVTMEKETKPSDEYKLNIISMSDIDLENKSSSKKYNMITKQSKNNVNLQRYSQITNC